MKKRTVNKIIQAVSVVLLLAVLGGGIYFVTAKTDIFKDNTGTETPGDLDNSKNDEVYTVSVSGETVTSSTSLVLSDKTEFTVNGADGNTEVAYTVKILPNCSLDVIVDGVAYAFEEFDLTDAFSIEQNGAVLAVYPIAINVLLSNTFPGAQVEIRGDIPPYPFKLVITVNKQVTEIPFGVPTDDSGIIGVTLDKDEICF